MFCNSSNVGANHDSLARSITTSGNRSVQFVDELIERRDIQIQNDHQHTSLSCEARTNVIRLADNIANLRLPTHYPKTHKIRYESKQGTSEYRQRQNSRPPPSPPRHGRHLQHSRTPRTNPLLPARTTTPPLKSHLPQLPQRNSLFAHFATKNKHLPPPQRRRRKGPLQNRRRRRYRLSHQRLATAGFLLP